MCLSVALVGELEAESSDLALSRPLPHRLSASREALALVPRHHPGSAAEPDAHVPAHS